MLLSARRVGPSGKAYGLDMTDEMLALARENQRKAGVDNVEFLKGEIEDIPASGQLRGRHHLELRDQSVGRQGSRVRRGVPRASPGRALRGLGRRGARRGARRRSAGASSCGSGAWPARSRKTSTEPSSAKAGFEDIDLEPTRIYRAEDARDFLPAQAGAGIDASSVDGKFMSAFVRARKPRPV